MAFNLLIVRNIIIAITLLMVACKPLRTRKNTPPHSTLSGQNMICEPAAFCHINHVHALPDSLKKSNAREVPDESINVHYENGLISFNSIIDMQEDFYIELKGSFKSQNKTSGKVEQDATRDKEDMQPNSANCAIKNYISAQKMAERGEYTEAMVSINNSIDCLNSGEALALKGSIYFLMKDTSSAESYWMQATLKDPSITVPKIRK